jgi:hypothetical protein
MDAAPRRFEMRGAQFGQFRRQQGFNAGGGSGEKIGFTQVSILNRDVDRRWLEQSLHFRRRQTDSWAWSHRVAGVTGNFSLFIDIFSLN